ncbi:MAG: NAD(P)-dependent oxidoreductase [Candidatus Hermodarchaeota archaeon]
MSRSDITVCFISTISKDVQNYLTENLKNLSNVKIIFPEDTSEESLLKLVPNAEILIGWRPSKKILDRATKLKIFINPGAGINHLLELFTELNKERKVLLINGHGNSYFVAQHVVALLLALMNKILPHHQWMKEGRWRTGDENAISIPLRSREIGLLGYGAINQKVHQFLSGFDLNFHILRNNWNKQTKELPTPAKKYNFNQFYDFLEEIDVLIIAIPVTSLTLGLIKAQEISLLGSKGIIVNVARGEIIKQEDLYNALKNRIIMGAAIDVWYDYHPSPDNNGLKWPYNFPFHTLDNIILSPHRGYSPFNDLLRWNEVVENITRIANGAGNLINIVDLEQGY